jgi:hypothetical protein
MMRKIALLFISSGLSAGCGTLSNYYDPAKISESQLMAKSGIVILSAGAPEHCMSIAMFLKVLPETINYYGTPAASLPVDVYTVKSDFKDHHGSLHAVSLPAGNYYLAPVISNPNVRAVKLQIAKFSVAAGEVVYLGEYFMPVACVFNPRVEFRDQQKRDLELLALKNPQLAKSKIVVRPPTLSEYNFQR